MGRWSDNFSISKRQNDRLRRTMFLSLLRKLRKKLGYGGCCTKIPCWRTGFALKLWRALKKDDIDLAMSEMRAYLAGIPDVEGFKKKLAEVSNYEGFYEYTFYLIFSMLNVYARTQVKCAGDEIDVVVEMPGTTYVFELKVNGTAQEALGQIDRKGYATPYLTEGCKVVKVGIQFDRDTMTVGNYIVAG